MLVESRLDVARLRPRRYHPGRHPDAQAEGIELRWRNVVGVAAGLVVRNDVGRALPQRRLHQRGDQLLLDAHPDRHVGGRMLVQT